MGERVHRIGGGMPALGRSATNADASESFLLLNRKGSGTSGDVRSLFSLGCRTVCSQDAQERVANRIAEERLQVPVRPEMNFIFSMIFLYFFGISRCKER